MSPNDDLLRPQPWDVEPALTGGFLRCGVTSSRDSSNSNPHHRRRRPPRQRSGNCYGLDASGFDFIASSAFSRAAILSVAASTCRMV